MAYTILDCYTDEPAGLGVPPYLGTHPRYLAGYLKEKYNEEIDYITIDDLRAYKVAETIAAGRSGWVGTRTKNIKPSQKTGIKTYNLTKNFSRIKDVLNETKTLFVILGVQTPGKYLSAVPGTLNEVIALLKELNLRCKKILTGPAVFGTQLYGGRFFEKADLSFFDSVTDFDFSYDDIKDFAIKGSSIIKQIPDLRIVEIETGHGCRKGKCSFCIEPIKYSLGFREKEDIIAEVSEFYKSGIEYFRIGKQSDFYAYPKAVELLEEIRKNFPGIKVLHIDNVDPVSVVNDKDNRITKAIVKCCTAGNVAALGIESFDPVVIRENCLNSTPEMSYKAIKLLNKFGSEREDNGMPSYLPGINLVFGLKGESKNTSNENLLWLKRILNESLLVRRINIRQVAIFEGTPLFKECGDKFLRKNRRYYWKWRNEIRQNIDFPMLKKLVPAGTILKDVRMEIYDGNTTFGRQIGTYPLIVGVKQRLELGKFYNIKVTSHMLRSVVGVAV